MTQELNLCLLHLLHWQTRSLLLAPAGKLLSLRDWQFYLSIQFYLGIPLPASRDSERLSPTPAPDSPHAIPRPSSVTRLAMVRDCVQRPEMQIEVLLSASGEGLPYSSGTAPEYSCFSSSSQYSVPVRDMELL